MKIVNICTSDWANFQHSISNALRAAGADCIDLKCRPHGFKYASESKIVAELDIAFACQGADVIQIFHSDFSMMLFGGKRKIVYHTGTGYRQDPEHNNNFFNPKVDFCFTDQTEFMTLGGKKITYTTTAVDVDRICPKKKVGDKIRIGHFPSKTKNDLKGTNKITEMLFACKELFDKQNRFELCFDNILCSHAEYLEKIQGVDIYVELFATEQMGKPYGCYGVTAFEAAAMGKAVVTMNTHPEVYKKEYGATELIYANDRNQFFSEIETLMRMSVGELEKKQAATREWCVAKHSYKAVGEKILKKLENNI